MFTIELALYKLYICGICGYSSHIREIIEECNSVPPNEVPNVVIGEEVTMYTSTWKGNRFIYLALESQPYTVIHLYYLPLVRTGLHLFTGGRATGHHQLCIHLRQTITADGRKAWHQGDDGGKIDAYITYKEFLLRREGDPKKLEAAGLIKPRHT